MKRYKKILFFIGMALILSFMVFSCSSKPAMTPPPAMTSPSPGGETAALRAEFAAQKAEEASRRAQEAAERIEKALKNLEGESQKVEEQQWQKEGILLHIVSDSQLNLYQGNHHTLLICVYQLKDPNTFNNMTEDSAGISKLLECDRSELNAVSSKKLVLQPEREISEFLDKAEGAKYIGVVAGYYQLRKENASRLLRVPSSEEMRAAKGRSKQRSSPVIQVNLYMGPQEIREMNTYE
jgi:type VI secretion system VasD/TssJ family lipoprotein